MVSAKRLIYLVIIFLIITAVIIVYDANETYSQRILIQNSSEDFGGSEKNDLPLRADPPSIKIIGTANDERSGGVYRNVREFLKGAHFSVIEEERFEIQEATPDDFVVFCSDDLTKCTDSSQLRDFLSNGGHVILAAGLSEGNIDSSFWSLLEIDMKTTMLKCTDMVFEKPFLPIQTDEMRYKGESLSVGMDLTSNAEVYVSDKKTGTPVLYSVEIGKGGAAVINGSFLENNRLMGLLTGAFCAVSDDFLYPVMGTKTVFLDHFPMNTDINDEICLRLYGSSSDTFIGDTVWPNFSGMSLRTDTPLTCGMDAIASSQSDFPPINSVLFTSLGKSVLQYKGEIAYAANCPQGDKPVFDENLIENFHARYPNYQVTSLLVESGEFSEDMLNIDGASIKSVRETPDCVGPLLKNKENVTVFPEVSSGNHIEDGALLEIFSTIGAYGFVSHTFDFETLIVSEGNIASWDIDKRQLGIFETEVLSRSRWLEGKTLSQTKEPFHSYQNLTYAFEREQNNVKIYCSGALYNQPFLYHTQTRIKSAEGIEYEDIGNGYYILYMKNNSGIISVEEF